MSAATKRKKQLDRYVVTRRVVIDYDFRVSASSVEEAEALIEQLTNEEAYNSDEMDRFIHEVRIARSPNEKGSRR